jgi:hypothetical protein
MRRPRTGEYGPSGKQEHHPLPALLTGIVNQRAARLVTLKQKGASHGSNEHGGAAETIPGSSAERPGRHLVDQVANDVVSGAATDLSRITMMTGQTRRQVVETALRELASSLRAAEKRRAELDDTKTPSGNLAR